MQVTAANVIWDRPSFSSREEFWEEAERQLQTLQSKGVQIVLFPGFTGLLHGLCGSPHRGSIFELLSQITAQKAAFEAEFSQLAKKYDIYLCSGTTVTQKNNCFYITASLFDPRGKKLGEQEQTHLSAQEKKLGLKRGTLLPVWETEVGRLGIVAGSDIWHPEVSRILALQGANLVLAPAAVPGPYNRWLQLAGMWQQVQQNQFFALENWFQGSILHIGYQGEAVALAPCEMTPDYSGYLPSHRSPGIARLDFQKREEVIKNYPLLAHLNRPLYRDHFPGLYEREVNHDSHGLTGKNS